MLPNQYQNLGSKTLFIFLFSAAVFPLMVLAVLIALRRFIYIFAANDIVSPYLPFISSVIILLIFADLIFFILMLLIAYWQYRNYKFKIDVDSFKVMHGVLTREEMAIPYRRIESVNLRETLLYQIFGVSRLTIEIVSDDDTEVEARENTDDEVLPVIDRHLALGIQEELTKRANIQKMHIHEP